MSLTMSQIMSQNWIEKNSIDYDLLLSNCGNTIENFLFKYNVKKIHEPMTEEILFYIINVIKENPQTFHNYNIYIMGNSVYGTGNLQKTLINKQLAIDKLLEKNKKLSIENCLLKIAN
jgi:hypothetical protein